MCGTYHTTDPGFNNPQTLSPVNPYSQYFHRLHEKLRTEMVIQEVLAFRALCFVFSTGIGVPSVACRKGQGPGLALWYLVWDRALKYTRAATQLSWGLRINADSRTLPSVSKYPNTRAVCDNKPFEIQII